MHWEQNQTNFTINLVEKPSSSIEKILAFFRREVSTAGYAKTSNSMFDADSRSLVVVMTLSTMSANSNSQSRV